MTNNELQELINQSVAEIRQIQQKEKPPTAGMCQVAINKLKELGATISKNIDTDQRFELTKSCSAFNTRELSLISSKASKVLSKANYIYAKHYDLIDPEIAKLLDGGG